MKSLPLLTLALAVAAGASAADSNAKDDLSAAARKLGEQPNYSWKSTVVVPESAPFKPGPTEGKTEKDGFTYVEVSFGENITEIVIKGDKAVVTSPEGGWKLASELENAEGPGRFVAMMARNIRTPATQISDLLPFVKELKKDGDAYAAELSEEGAKKQFRFGQPKDPKGWVKFWIKDGMPAKYEVKVEAKMEFNGNEFDAARTTTTEIREIGTTKVNVPAEAKQKLM